MSSVFTLQTDLSKFDLHGYFVYKIKLLSTRMPRITEFTLLRSLTKNNSFIIGDRVVSNAYNIYTIRSIRNIKDKVNISEFPIVSYGSDLLDNNALKSFKDDEKSFQDLRNGL